MDLVTLIAIVAAPAGEPVIWQKQTPAERCEVVSARIRTERPGTVAWCRSELRPSRISDELQSNAAIESVPDGMDGLGMPGQRSIPGIGR